MMSSTCFEANHHVGNADSWYNNAFLDGLSRQMTMYQGTRGASRMPNANHQRTGSAMSGAMRVAKPKSANNSPRSSTTTSRRKTMMNEQTLAARRRQQLDQAVMSTPSTTMADSGVRSSRPLSWHPASYQTQSAAYFQNHQQLSQYPFPSPDEVDSMSAYQPHYSPIPPAYSCGASPHAAFSPLSIPQSDFDTTTPCMPADNWSIPPQAVPSYVSTTDDSASGYVEAFPTFAHMGLGSTLVSPWAGYVPQDLSSTTPPTPESVPQAQQTEPLVTSEESIAFEPLDQQEDDGEILIGMGLYDAPDKCNTDPQLDRSKSAMSALFGSSLYGLEGTGKGLKLEEAWQPPESDDEGDEDEEDEDEDEDEDDD